jgi:hypothetical protein
VLRPRKEAGIYLGQRCKSIRNVGLSLPLFMAGILANHPHYTVAADDFAIAANFLYRGAYFHCYSPDSIHRHRGNNSTS